jgi:hypothetical protein
MQIHHVESTYEEKWVFDPQTGPGKQRVAKMLPSALQCISVPGAEPGRLPPFPSSPTGASFDAGDDGSFVVPDDVAVHFLAMPGWHEGISPFPPANLAPTEENLRPAAVSKVPKTGESSES